MHRLIVALLAVATGGLTSAPGRSVPSVTVPSGTVPSVTVPSVTIPSVTVPSVTVPSVTTPAITTPSVTTPAVSTPSVTTPEIAATTDGPSIKVSTPKAGDGTGSTGITTTTSAGSSNGTASPPGSGRSRAGEATGSSGGGSTPGGSAPANAGTTGTSATSGPHSSGDGQAGNAGATSGSQHSRAGAGHTAAGGGHTPRKSGSPRPADTLASAAGSASTRAGHARQRRGARLGHAARPATVQSSPIATTITRIVGVIPTFVWALIVALAALALALAVRTRLAALRARRLERQRGELLADVGLLQAALLSTPPARLGPVGASVAYRPADGPGAGGDFYDVFALEDGRVGVIVGDVSGHGRPALPHTALVRYTLRAYLEAGQSPREAVRTAGSVLERQLAGSFATVVLATYHPRERTLTYACAGHPPPLVLRGAGSRQAVAARQEVAPGQRVAPGSPGFVRPLPLITAGAAPPLGAGRRTGTRQSIISIPGRAQLCFYTDGLTEARVGSGGERELYGADRLACALAELGPTASAEKLLDRVARDTSARPDDMACSLLTIEGEDDGPPVTLVEEALLGRAELDADVDRVASERTVRFLLACGAEPAEIPELMRSAAELAGRSGAVLVEVDMDVTAGRSRVALRPDNVAPLRTAGAALAVGG